MRGRPRVRRGRPATDAAPEPIADDAHAWWLSREELSAPPLRSSPTGGGRLAQAQRAASRPPAWDELEPGGPDPGPGAGPGPNPGPGPGPDVHTTTPWPADGDDGCGPDPAFAPAGRPLEPDFASDDPHRVLGLPHDATWAEITQAYRGLAKAWHPDVAGVDDDGPMRAITSAYGRLRAARAGSR